MVSTIMQVIFVYLLVYLIIILSSKSFIRLNLSFTVKENEISLKDKLLLILIVLQLKIALVTNRSV